jgi:hypothetical protein
MTRRPVGAGIGGSVRSRTCIVTYGQPSHTDGGCAFGALPATLEATLSFTVAQGARCDKTPAGSGGQVHT